MKSPTTEAIPVTNITRHPLLQQAYDVCQAIEQCGASVPLTNAVTKASSLLADLDKFIPHPQEAIPVNDQAIEQEIQAKGLTAPRVSFAELQANIAHTEIVKHVSPSGQVLRWAVLTTLNGFAVTGRPSASASSANDNAEIGEKIAIENATQELWPLMGYALKQQLHEAK